MRRTLRQSHEWAVLMVVTSVRCVGSRDACAALATVNFLVVRGRLTALRAIHVRVLVRGLHRAPAESF